MNADILGMIDHTLLKPEATSEQIKILCQEAETYGFASVCVNGVYVPLAAELLKDSDVAVCTVVGFPLGAMAAPMKAQEAALAIEQGATEIDMVIHIGGLKDGNTTAVQDDIAAVAAVCREKGALSKVIIEAVLLTDAEKVTACELAQAAGADFVKTSTGFAGGGATVHDVALMRETVGLSMGVKAAGGVRSLADALAMVEAGASRIGASAGVAIAKEISGQASESPSSDY